MERAQNERSSGLHESSCRSREGELKLVFPFVREWKVCQEQFYVSGHVRDKINIL